MNIEHVIKNENDANKSAVKIDFQKVGLEANIHCKMNDVIAIEYWNIVDTQWWHRQKHPFTKLWEKYEKEEIDPIRKDVKKCRFVAKCILKDKCVIDTEFRNHLKFRDEKFFMDPVTGDFTTKDGTIISLSSKETKENLAKSEPLIGNI